VEVSVVELVDLPQLPVVAMVDLVVEEQEHLIQLQQQVVEQVKPEG